MPQMPQLQRPEPPNKGREFIYRLRDFMLGAGSGPLSQAGSRGGQAVMAGRRQRDAQSFQQQQYTNQIAVQDYNMRMQRWKMEREQAAADRVLAGRNKTAKFLVEQGILPAEMVESMDSKQLYEAYKDSKTLKEKKKDFDIVKGADGFQYKVYHDGRPAERAVAGIEAAPEKPGQFAASRVMTLTKGEDVVTVNANTPEGQVQVNELIQQGYKPVDKSGLAVTYNPETGEFQVTQGQKGGGKGGQIRESQSKDIFFVNKGEGALENLKKYYPALSSLKDQTLDYFGPLAPYLQGTEYQLARQAGREFIEAILRKESGAAIPPAERVAYEKTYLPQAGEPPEVVAQKLEAQRRALDGLRKGLPANLILQQEKAFRAEQKTLQQRPETTDPEKDPLGLF